MRYRITHRTTYTYAVPAHDSFNEVRLRPVSDEHQTCLDFSLNIDPPASVIAYEDYYGNAVHEFGIPYLHDRPERSKRPATSSPLPPLTNRSMRKC